MAGGKIQKLKKRMITVANTEKITKAMGLVATAKLGTARDKITKSRPYFEILHQSLTEIVMYNRDFSSPYLQERPVENIAVVVIGGDRGMAGSFHSRLFQTADHSVKQNHTSILPIGRKSLDFFTTSSLPLLSSHYPNTDRIHVGDCFDLSKMLCKGFLEHQFDQLILVYTHFTSMLEQTPVTLPLLPLYRNSEPETSTQQRTTSILYQPNGETVYNAIVPEYVAGLLYGAVCESRAAELCARHNAMDTASKNAQEMADKLHLQYNRERQGQITQEITEIIAGAGEL